MSIKEKERRRMKAFTEKEIDILQEKDKKGIINMPEIVTDYIDCKITLQFNENDFTMRIFDEFGWSNWF